MCVCVDRTNSKGEIAIKGQTYGPWVQGTEEDIERIYCLEKSKNLELMWRGAKRPYYIMYFLFELTFYVERIECNCVECWYVCVCSLALSWPADEAEFQSS